MKLCCHKIAFNVVNAHKIDFIFFHCLKLCARFFNVHKSKWPPCVCVFYRQKINENALKSFIYTNIELKTLWPNERKKNQNKVIYREDVSNFKDKQSTLQCLVSTSILKAGKDASKTFAISKILHKT